MYASWKVSPVDQLSKCKKSEWVTSEKYVVLISARSEEVKRAILTPEPRELEASGFQRSQHLRVILK